MKTKEIIMWAVLGLLTLSNISLHLDAKQDDVRMKRVGAAVRAGVEARGARSHDWSQARGERSRPQRTRPEGKKDKPRVK
jgi:hypothetical protein